MDTSEIFDTLDGPDGALPVDPHDRRGRMIHLLINLAGIIFFVLIVLIARQVWIFHRSPRAKVAHGWKSEKKGDSAPKEKLKKEI